MKAVSPAQQATATFSCPKCSATVGVTHQQEYSCCVGVHKEQQCPREPLIYQGGKPSSTGCCNFQLPKMQHNGGSHSSKGLFAVLEFRPLPMQAAERNKKTSSMALDFGMTARCALHRCSLLRSPLLHTQRPAIAGVLTPYFAAKEQQVHIALL